MAYATRCLAAMKLIRWDFEHNLATEYERLGECNGCAECCIEALDYKTAGEYTTGPGPMGAKLRAEGVWCEYQEGGTRLFIRQPSAPGRRNRCRLLSATGCAMHRELSVSYGALCHAWPILPEHITLLPACSYTFREVKHWSIHEDSPQSEP